ncbi:MAG: fused MFS/spermidine synthase, partial [Chloroflexota bacterium]|nr:fused MFS/spermidine synthase [Chloroflexota bacterium]
MIDNAPVGASPEPAGARRIGRYEAYVVVFAASAITLIIEIVAARILAPHIGVSVYTWTSVIGVILAGISLGNWLGGMLADRAASRALLGLILLAGAAATLLILPLAQLAPDWVSQAPLLLRIVLLTGLLFLAPALVLGMVSPMVVKLTLSDISVTGNVVGRIYAVSTAGAIVGVFLTGFVLIQALGSRETLLALAVFTAMMAIGTGRLWQIPGKLIAGILLLGALGVFTWSQQSFASGCIAESNYYCIKVWDRELEDDDPVRVLALDRLVHS